MHAMSGPWQELLGLGQLSPNGLRNQTRLFYIKWR